MRTSIAVSSDADEMVFYMDGFGKKILFRGESLCDVVKRKMRGYIGASSGLHSAVPLCSSIHDVIDTRSVRIICILFASVFVNVRNRGFAGGGNRRLYSSNDASNRHSCLRRL